VRSQIFPRINVEKLIYPYEAIGEKIWVFSCWAQIVKYNKTKVEETGGPGENHRPVESQ
jgi:hypothetical protein